MPLRRSHCFSEACIFSIVAALTNAEASPTGHPTNSCVASPKRGCAECADLWVDTSRFTPSAYASPNHDRSDFRPTLPTCPKKWMNWIDYSINRICTGIPMKPTNVLKVWKWSKTVHSVLYTRCAVELEIRTTVSSFLALARRSESVWNKETVTRIRTLLYCTLCPRSALFSVSTDHGQLSFSMCTPHFLWLSTFAGGSAPPMRNLHTRTHSLLPHILPNQAPVSPPYPLNSTLPSGRRKGTLSICATRDDGKHTPLTHGYARLSARPTTRGGAPEDTKGHICISRASVSLRMQISTGGLARNRRRSVRDSCEGNLSGKRRSG